MSERTQRTLNDLKRGRDAHAADVLRLALHYIIRGGWAATFTPRAGAVKPAIGVIDGAYSAVQAIGRARQELCAPWMRGVEASQALREAAGLRAWDVKGFTEWERAAGRTGDDVREAFKRAIGALVEREKGLLLDVAV